MEPSLSLGWVMVALGLLLLAADFFLPTGGILSVLSLAALVVGVAMAFNSDPTSGIIMLVVVFVAVPVIVGYGFLYLPKTRMGKRFVLTGAEEDVTVASMPVNLELENLRG